MLGIALRDPQLLLQGDGGELAAWFAPRAQINLGPRPARRRPPAALHGDGGGAQGLARNAARRRAQAPARRQDRRHRASASSTTAVQVRLAKAEDADAAFKELRGLVQPTGRPHSRHSAATTSRCTRREGGVIVITPTEAGLQHRITDAISAAIETVRRRVDAMGTTEPQIVRQGSDRILVQVPGLQDTAQLKELIGKTARLSFHEVHPTITAEEAKQTRPPAGLQDLSGLPTARRATSCCARRRWCAATSSRVRSRPSTSRPTSRSSPSPSTTSGARKFGDFTKDTRRPPVRHRARRQGDLGAGHPRADPGRLGPDQRQLHGRDRQPARDPAALGRAAGQAHDHRGAHGRAPASAQDSIEAGKLAGAHRRHRGRRLHDLRLRPARHLRRRRRWRSTSCSCWRSCRSSARR